MHVQEFVQLTPAGGKDDTCDVPECTVRPVSDRLKAVVPVEKMLKSGSAGQAGL